MNFKMLFLSACSLLISTTFAATPGDIFQKNKGSIFEVIALSADGQSGSQGSAVAISPSTLVTNCHVLKGYASITVGTGESRSPASLVTGDSQKDICIILSNKLNAIPVTIGTTVNLKIGDTVYAIGAPKGLELSLSKGIVSQLRGASPKLIQHDAAITHGSSGGGLFDESGNLIGITNSGIEGANINFALPVEYVSSVAHIAGSKIATANNQPAEKTKVTIPDFNIKTEIDWAAEAATFQDRNSWRELENLSISWLQADPHSEYAIWFLCLAKTKIKDYRGVIEASKQFLTINPNSATVWDLLNVGAQHSKIPLQAVEAGRRAVALDATKPVFWNNLGVALYDLAGATNDLSQARASLDAYQKAITLDKTSATWHNIGSSYFILGDRKKSIAANIQATKIDSDNYDAWLDLATANIDLKHTDEAFADLKQCYRLNQNDPDVLNNLGRISIIAYKDKLSAQRYAEELQAIDPRRAAEIFDLIRQ